MDIILIRHGETVANIEKKFGDGTTELTEKGVNQAKKSSYILESNEKRVLISPYKRALDTAKYLGLEGEIEEELREISMGIMEGYSYMEFREKNEEEARQWAEDSINYRITNGESVVDLYKRVERLMYKLIEDDEDIILVCHDGVIRAMLSCVFEDPNLFFKFKSDNLGFTKISVNDGYKYISYMNRIYY